MDALPTNRTWPPSCSHGTYQHKAITSRSRQLLMMGTWLPETCWATIIREIKNTKVTSSWFFLSTLSVFYLFVYLQSTHTRLHSIKVNGLVRLARVLSRAPPTDGTQIFTQSSLLASIFEVVDFLVIGCRGLLLVGCGDLSYDLYFSWLLLKLLRWCMGC